MTTLIIKTNVSQVTDVLIKDLGFLIPNSGGNVTFTDLPNLQDCNTSVNLRTLATDDAYGAGSSTLILNNGTSDIAQADVDTFLNEISGTQGATGILGLTGLYGITGFSGSTGIRGLTGIQGPTGIQGLTGFSSTGIQGITGFSGSTGIQGLTGFSSTGIQGITGFSGSTGIQGNTGLTGPTGFQGGTGTQGLTGVRGLTGIQGPTGIQGIQGITGSQGLTGSQGITGTAGPTGVQGLTGIQGITGGGITGVQGLTGLLGITGLSYKSQIIGATGTITTTATAYPAFASTGLLGAASIPTAGTYVVIFGSSVSQSANTNSVKITMFVAGTEVINSVRTWVRGTGASTGVVSTQVLVTVDGTQIIDMRWLVNTGTGTMNQRSMTFIQVS
jgi:hypothetical protein